MRFFVDFHIHSKFSRATSKDMEFEVIVRWAKLKGIKLIGTGDFTHPEWLYLIKEKLVQKDNGFLVLKDTGVVGNGPFKDLSIFPEDTYFILSSEVSLIYQKSGMVRKIHLMILAPSVDFCEKINRSIERFGKLTSDGRPMLGLDAKSFLEIILTVCPDCMVIPAHIWTPWFSLLGSFSGFNSVKECFEELTPYITALETGLSSDPAMNWRLSSLDAFSLVSNSDAHSPDRIGREANLFNCDFNFHTVKSALEKKDKDKFLMTIEFFPEEGKYHFDGHRACNVRLHPSESRKSNLLCPVCGKKLTIGVLHRVEELADREQGFIASNSIPFIKLVPLNEVLGEVMGKASDSKAVLDEYFRLIRLFGNELSFLIEVPIEEIERKGGPDIALAISSMREGKVETSPGYDGVYGKIRVLSEKYKEKEGEQLKLF
ncbi:MAG: endonuclease Q family protein [Candidatus Aminicenantia bacterium]